MPESDHNRTNVPVQDWSSALEAQFGLTTPETEPTAIVPDAEPSVAALQERLAFYEHFDALIKDNISRSAALFQAVYTERQNARTARAEAEAAMNAVSVEAERRVEAQRTHVQHILASLMEDATALRRHSEAVMQRIAEAMTEIAPQSNEDDEPVVGA